MGTDEAHSVDHHLAVGGFAERLRHRAAENPEMIALLHKQRGRWRAFRWRDILHDVEKLRDGLQVPSGLRLVVSGAYEPDLIAVALAAYAAGGQIFPVPRALQGNILRDTLAEIRPTHSFVQVRRDIPHWLQTAASVSSGFVLLSRHAATSPQEGFTIVSLQSLRGSPSKSIEAGRLRTVVTGELAWIMREQSGGRA